MVLLLNKNDNFLLKSHELINLDKIKEHKLQQSFYNIGLGPFRYATSYVSEGVKNNIYDSQPIKGNNVQLGEFFLVHNGNINFSSEIKDKYSNLNDSNILVKIIEDLTEESWYCIFEYIISMIPGVFNVIVTTSNCIYCFNGYNVRPLCYR